MNEWTHMETNRYFLFEWKNENMGIVEYRDRRKNNNVDVGEDGRIGVLKRRDWFVYSDRIEMKRLRGKKMTWASSRLSGGGHAWWDGSD